MEKTHMFWLLGEKKKLLNYKIFFRCYLFFFWFKKILNILFMF